MVTFRNIALVVFFLVVCIMLLPSNTPPSVWKAIIIGISILGAWGVLDAAKARRESSERRKPNIEIQVRRVGPSSGPGQGKGWTFSVDLFLTNRSSTRAYYERGEAFLEHPMGDMTVIMGGQRVEIPPDGGRVRLRADTPKILQAEKTDVPRLKWVKVWIFGRDQPFVHTP